MGIFKVDPETLNTKEDFQILIDKEDIKNPSDFWHRFPSIFKKLKNMEFKDDLIYHPKPKKAFCGISSRDFEKLEDFQKLIDEKGITSAPEFSSSFRTIYLKMCTLKLNKLVVYVNSENKQILKNIKTLEDAQKYIDDNNIKSYTHLKEFNYTVFNHICLIGRGKMGELKYHPDPDPETKDEIQAFITKNEIKNPEDFTNRFTTLYKKVKERFSSEDFDFFGREEQDRMKRFIKTFNTLEDFQKFINDNNIKSFLELKTKYKEVYNRLRHLSLARKVKYCDGEPILETEKDFQDYINKNNIESPKDFAKQNKKAYEKLIRHKLTDKVVYGEKYESEKRIREELAKTLNSIEDFQEFINKNNIKTVKEFKNDYPREFGRYSTLFNREEKKKIRFTEDSRFFLDIDVYNIDEVNEYLIHNNIKNLKELDSINHPLCYAISNKLSLEQKRSLSFSKSCFHLPEEDKEVKTLEEIQDYIIKNKIYSMEELRTRSYIIYNTYMDLKKNSNKDVIFLCSKCVRSKQEAFFLKDLIRFGITDFSFNRLILIDENGNKKIYDAFIPSINTIVEIHGGFHFDDEAKPNTWETRNELENDILKYNLAIKNGYKIYYITYDSWYLYKRFGYFQPVYHTALDLFNAMGIEVKENPNYEQDFMSLFSDDFIDLINKICKGFEIHNQEELNKFDNLSWLVSEFNLYNKIIYYKEEEQDLQEQQ